MNKYYPLIRTLHLYFGLLVSPFLLIFSISVLVLSHPALFLSEELQQQESQTKVNLETIQSEENNILAAKEIIRQLNISGEIDWISKTDSTISFPVHLPGVTHNIFLNTRTGQASVSRIGKGTLSGMAYLHMMPGMHNAALRGNSLFMKIWRVATDSLVYIILFVTSSGVFLWYFLKPERNFGMYSLGIGSLLFLILMFLLT